MKQNKLVGETMTYIVLAALFIATSAVAGAVKIPDMTGQWEFTVGVTVTYANVFDPNGQPVYSVHTNVPPSTPPVIDIRSQNARVFAGHFVSGDSTNVLTGVVMDDKTFTMQMYDGPNNNRSFFSGKLSIAGKTMTIKGNFHSFEDVSLTSEPSIGTAYFEATKQ